MANCIALWYETGNSTQDFRHAELHINLWRLPNGSSKICRFIDFGLFIKVCEGIKSLKVYIPNHKEDNPRLKSFCNSTQKELEFIDLGNKLKSPGNLQTLFNEDYSISSPTSSKYINVTGQSDEEFSIYCIDIKSDIEKESKFGGTIYSINLDDAKGKLYFRFRLIGDNIANFVLNDTTAKIKIQSVFWKNEIIDFRINEKRNLNNSLLEKVKGEFIFDELKFFLMCPSSEEVISLSHGPYKRCRRLENDLWLDYVNINNNYLHDKSLINVYQWNLGSKKNESGLTHLNMMIRLKFEKYNIILYFIILFIVTLSFNLSYDLLKSIIQ